MHYCRRHIIAVELAILINFVWHERWTWQDRPASEHERGATAAIQRDDRNDFDCRKCTRHGCPGRIALAVAGCRQHYQRRGIGAVNFVGADTLVFRSAVGWSLRARDGAERATRRMRRSSRPKTARGFAKYAAAVEARRDKTIANNEPFLDFERHSPPSRRESWPR